jgi:hypothetical protein
MMEKSDEEQIVLTTKDLRNWEGLLQGAINELIGKSENAEAAGGKDPMLNQQVQKAGEKVVNVDQARQNIDQVLQGLKSRMGL